MDTNSLVSIAKALSGPTCRRLLQEITKGDIDVGVDLFQYISISQPPTSQLLNFLAVAGLVGLFVAAGGQNYSKPLALMMEAGRTVAGSR